MDKYKIKSKKQDNGLWGMPLMVKSYKCALREKYYDLENAIIITIAETLGDNYEWMDVGDFGEGLVIDLSKHKKIRTMYPQFNQYHLEGDTLIYFNTSDLKERYLRQKKFERLIKQTD